MALSYDLISDFAKITNDTTIKTKQTIAYGTVVRTGSEYLVRIDGADDTTLTPFEKTVTVKVGDRVRLSIENHTVTVTGNISDPSYSSLEGESLNGKISEFDVIISHKISTDEIYAILGQFERIEAIFGKYENLEAIYAEIEKLKAMYIDVDHLNAKDIEAINAYIENLKAELIEAGHISAEDIEAIFGYFENLYAYNADFVYVSAEVIKALKAKIDMLDVDSLLAHYAQIDFANITEAAIKKIFADSGIIKDLVTENGVITGELVGVTIHGDLIQGGTIVADKLVVKGEDGLYYKLNLEGLGEDTLEQIIEEEFGGDGTVFQDGLHGSNIIAHTITADRINVSDLVAFDATIGGFNISMDSIYSGVKESVNNTTPGIYMDKKGQFAVGNAFNFIKFYYDEDEKDWKMLITADKIILGSNGKTVQETIDDIEIGSVNLLRETAIPDPRFFINSEVWELTEETLYNSCQIVKTHIENAGLKFLFNNQIEILNNIVPNTTFCYSIWARTDDIDNDISVKILANGTVYDPYLNSSEESVFIDDYPENNIITDEWKRFYYIFDVPAERLKYLNGSITDMGFIQDIACNDGKFVYWACPKLEIGNKPTTWSPSPEDINNSLDNKASNDDLKNVNNQLTDAIRQAELLIDNINATISTLIVDENGESLMTQTGSGWQFNLNPLQSSLDKNAKDIQDESDKRSRDVSDLNSKVSDLQGKTAYINIGTNNTGDPTIILGREGSKFKVVISNSNIDFMYGDTVPAYVNNDIFYGENITAKKQLKIGENPGFIWERRSNGHFSLMYSNN